uniref:Uncharacterized protein n=1 Tax=Oryzias sinensis TaxID=183150 RepID=A0A8C7WW28_9TELE
MAISLVAAAKHTVKSVFQWDSCELDSVLLAGDQVYSDLQRQNKITDSAGFLRVTDLPDQVVVDGVELSCVFGEVVSGDAKINSGEFVDVGVLVPLKEGLVRMTAKYNTCLLTMCENTCAVIAENGLENLKKVKLDVAVEEQEVIFSEPEQEIFYFNPLNQDVCQALCSML